MTDRQVTFDNLRDRISESSKISDRDADSLNEFVRSLDLLSSQYSTARKAKLLNHLVILAEQHGNVHDVLTDRKASEAIVAWINRNYENEETNRDYRVALRVFAKLLTDGDDVPDSVDWIPSSTSSNYDPTPDPGKMLRWETDIQPMLKAAPNPRDRAAVALQFDAGLRGGEYYDLTVGSISDNRYGLQVTVEGKQGQRTVTLIPSVPYVEQWLTDHPTPDDPDAPLWCKLDKPKDTSTSFKIRLLKRTAKMADVTKPATPTNFRKSSAAHLASKGMNQAHLEDHHGWVRGSRVASRYVSVFAEESDRELARVYGKEVEPEKDDAIAPVECPRCGKETPREKPLCVWCGQALEPGAAEKAQELDDILVDEIGASDPSRASKLIEMRDRTRNDPEARAEMLDRIVREFS